MMHVPEQRERKISVAEWGQEQLASLASLHNKLIPANKPQLRLEMKIALVGQEGCGKSALATRLLTRRYITDYCPVLEDTYSRIIVLDGIEVTVHVMDTSDRVGSFSTTCDKGKMEVFPEDAFEEESEGLSHSGDTRIDNSSDSLREMDLSDSKDPGRYTQWADVIIGVYSVTSQDTLHKAWRTLEGLAPASGAPGHRAAPQARILVGNKNDLEMFREVTFAAATSLVERENIRVLETSASDDQESVDWLFATALKEYLVLNPPNLGKSPEELSPILAAAASNSDSRVIPRNLLISGVSVKCLRRDSRNETSKFPGFFRKQTLNRIFSQHKEHGQRTTTGVPNRS